MTRAWNVAVLVSVPIVVFLGALVGLWFFLQPTLLPGTDEIRRIGCDWRSYVSANVPKGGESYSDYATNIDCTVDDEIGGRSHVRRGPEGLSRSGRSSRGERQDQREQGQGHPRQACVRARVPAGARPGWHGRILVVRRATGGRSPQVRMARLAAHGQHHHVGALRRAPPGGEQGVQAGSFARGAAVTQATERFLRANGLSLFFVQGGTSTELVRPTGRT